MLWMLDVVPLAHDETLGFVRLMLAKPRQRASDP